MRVVRALAVICGVSLLVSCQRSPRAGEPEVAAVHDSSADGSATVIPTTADTAATTVTVPESTSTAPTSPAPLRPAPTPVASAKPTPKPPAPPQDSTTTGGATAVAAAPAANAPLRDAYHTAPLDTVDGKTYQGWKYFNLNCARCHGEDVSGTTIAPHLIVSLKPGGPIPDQATFVKTVCEGRLEKGMPAWCQLGLTREQIDTIYSYVKGRSDAKLHPGRPARKS